MSILATHAQKKKKAKLDRQMAKKRGEGLKPVNRGGILVWTEETNETQSH